MLLGIANDVDNLKADLNKLIKPPPSILLASFLRLVQRLLQRLALKERIFRKVHFFRIANI